MRGDVLTNRHEPLVTLDQEPACVVLADGELEGGAAGEAFGRFDFAGQGHEVTQAGG
jgi:hypothetical protein